MIKAYWCKYTADTKPRYMMIIPISSDKTTMKCLNIADLGEDMLLIKKLIRNKKITTQQELVSFAHGECKNFNRAFKTIRMVNLSILSEHEITAKKAG